MNEKIIKNSKWLLIFGAAVVVYTVIGGLITPLKTGVSGTNKFKINSLELDSASFEIYNPVQELNIQEVYLLLEHYDCLLRGVKLCNYTYPEH